VRALSPACFFPRVLVLPIFEKQPVVFAYHTQGFAMADAIDTQNTTDQRLRSLLRQLIRSQDGTVLPLPPSLIKLCMASYDIRLLGAVNSVLDMPQDFGRVSPKLDIRSILTFKMHYCERCLTEDPKNEWADSRYTAAWDFAYWFLGQYHKSAILNADLMLIEQWLKTFFLKSTPQVQICLTRTILAEILRERKIRHLFEDWEKHPDLQRAMQSALAQRSMKA
jgi:hypothetical protein